MGYVINKTTFHKISFISVSKYNSNDYLYNPVLPDCNKKYWKLVGNELQEMSPVEKAVIDQNELDAIATQEALLKDINSVSKLEKAAFLVFLGYINDLRTNASLSTISVNTLKNNVETKYDELSS